MKIMKTRQLKWWRNSKHFIRNTLISTSQSFRKELLRWTCSRMKESHLKVWLNRHKEAILKSKHLNMINNPFHWGYHLSDEMLNSWINGWSKCWRMRYWTRISLKILKNENLHSIRLKSFWQSVWETLFDKSQSNVLNEVSYLKRLWIIISISLKLRWEGTCLMLILFKLNI